uniref:Reverse transcriptase zinc-binding domain-containing protein n=1 Tax=Cacopsylla melanoneura TaxID=428564 RepID=A0A8D8YMK8_9HEMI
MHRIRTGAGKCADMMHKWGIHPSPECSNCGASKQTVAHIVHDCPTTLYPGNAEEFIFARANAISYSIYYAMLGLLSEMLLPYLHVPYFSFLLLIYLCIFDVKQMSHTIVDT